MINGGMFVTKSFFIDSEYVNKSLESVFIDNPVALNEGNVFSKYIYHIAMCCVNNDSSILSFSYMHQELSRLRETDVIDENTFSQFNNLGWQDNMKFGFFMPKKEYWEKLLYVRFSGFHKLKSQDVYSDFLIFIEL